MGLLSSSSRRNEQNFDQRQVNDASGGGIAGNAGTITINDTSGRTLADGIKLASSAQTQALKLAREALQAGTGSKATQTALVVAGVGLVAFALLSRR